MRRDFCQLDGQRCNNCGKCRHIPKKTGWLHRIFIIIIMFFILLIFLMTISAVGMNFAHNLLNEPNYNSNLNEKPTDYAHTSPTRYEDYKGPVPYYDTGFYVYTYQDNPATCGGGQCPKSEFAYV